MLLGAPIAGIDSPGQALVCMFAVACSATHVFDILAVTLRGIERSVLVLMLCYMMQLEEGSQPHG